MGSDLGFTSQIEMRTDVARVALSGELDMATAPLLEEWLAPLEADGAAVIMLDLRDVMFIDSSGLGVLLQASRRAQTNGHRFLVVGSSPAARHLFELTGTQFLTDDRAAGVLHRFAGNHRKQDLKPDSDRGPSG